ncbi:MAG: hypothetical protein ABI946_12265, partial [Chthoniobacterales bacterium]
MKSRVFRVLGSALVFLSLATIGFAATITVTNINDAGAGSLRAALTSAMDGDTIDFNLTGCPCTISLTSAALRITSDVTIRGPGADQLTITGNNARQVFATQGSAVSATISGLTIAN